MSSMANEMAARMREDGRDPGTETITPMAPPDPAAAEPGTERTPAQPAAPAPPAEALTTDTPRDGEEPGPVPYSRFREVNEAYQGLRGYEALRQYGYDPDSLGRLAQFEAAWVQDPGGTVAQMVDNLDLPEDQKTQMKEWLTSESDDGSAGGGNPPTPTADSADEPEWAKKLRERIEAQDAAESESRLDAQRQARLDAVVSHWDKLDEADGITTPEGTKLSFIATYAASGRYPTAEALAEAARAERMALRETDLGSTVVPTRNGPGPRSVPRSAAAAAPPQNFGGDIKLASKAAMAAIERGELPPIVPGG